MTAIQILMNKLHKSVHPATNLLTAPPSTTCLRPLFSHPSHPGCEPTEQTFSKRSPTLSSFLSHASAPVEPPACPLTVHSFTQRHRCSPRSPAVLRSASTSQHPAARNSTMLHDPHEQIQTPRLGREEPPTPRP